MQNSLLCLGYLILIVFVYWVELQLSKYFLDTVSVGVANRKLTKVMFRAVIVLPCVLVRFIQPVDVMKFLTNYFLI
jgi:hypothetical protein